MSKMLKDFVFFVLPKAMRFYFFVESIVNSLFSNNGKTLDVVMLSNYRDERDVELFGFSNNNIPAVMQWLPMNFLSQSGKKIKSRLYMIGSTSEQIAGERAMKETMLRARMQAIEAISLAEKKGAKVVLFGALTKRLFQGRENELREKFPEINFTLGDNFTGISLGETIVEVICRHKLKNPCILLQAPYGMLGNVSLWYLSKLEKEFSKKGRKFSVVLMGAKTREDLLLKISEKYNFDFFTSWEDLKKSNMKFDLVVSCNSANWARLNNDRINAIRRDNKKLIVVDPSEPPNITRKMFYSGSGKDIVLKYDAGNTYSKNFSFSLNSISRRVIGLDDGVVFGCFAEAIIIYAYRELWDFDWYGYPSKEGIKRLEKYFGPEFKNPVPTCFSKEISDFNIDISDESERGEERPVFYDLPIVTR